MTNPISSEEVEHSIREYLLAEFLLGEDPQALTASTPLISGGILDSIGVTRLITHLESTYSVRFESEEINVENLDTIPSIVSAVMYKLQDA